MINLPVPVPALEHVVIGGLPVDRVTVRISKWHNPFELYLICAGARFFVADNRNGKDVMFKHKSLARCVEWATAKANAYVRIEWAAFNRKKTLNG